MHRVSRHFLMELPRNAAGIPYNPALLRYRQAEDSHPTVRFWIWIIASFLMIIFVCFITNFIERCRDHFVFQSTSFRASVLCFCIAFILASIILYKSKDYQRRKKRMIWLHLTLLSVLAIGFCIAFLVLFTISIKPAYHEASIVFLLLAALFIVNLGCLLLYD